MATLAVVPARRGSRGLIHKNILLIDGVPAVLRSARAARDAGCRVVVSTDDPQVRSICDGFEIHWRIDDRDDPVDEVVKTVTKSLGWTDAVLLVQPTVQPVDVDVISRFIAGRQNTPMHMFTPFPHQLWVDRRWLTPRVNRQHITNPPLLELGIRWWPTPDRIGDLPLSYTTSLPLVDIDTIDDLRAAQPKATVVWQPLADDRHGRGHIHRCLTLAEQSQHHRNVFDISYCDPAAQKMIVDAGWEWTDNPSLPRDVTVLDVLDTTVEQIRQTPTSKIVTLEDLGEGARYADATVNALYGDTEMSGSDWCVLRPEFLHGGYTVNDVASKVLVMCGGTDPTDLTGRLRGLLPDATIIDRYADIPVAETMRHHDLLITTAGRTVFEAAAVGIPTVVMAANAREATHTHLNRGNIYLGLAASTPDDYIGNTVRQVLANGELRRDLSGSYQPDGRGVERIVHLIDGFTIGV